MEPWTDGAPLILKTELPMTRELRGWTEAGSVYRCITAILRRSLAGPPGSVYRCNASLAGPPASVYRCIGVLPQSCADRSRGPPWVGVSVYCRNPAAPIARGVPLGRCIGVSVYCRNPAPIARGVPLGRCIRVSVYCRTAAPIARGAPLGRCIGVLPHSPGRCIGVLLQSCADRSRGPPGSVYRCIAATLRRSLAKPSWVGAAVYRCILNFPPPLRGRTGKFYACTNAQKHIWLSIYVFTYPKLSDRVELLIELQEVVAGKNFGRRFADSLSLGFRGFGFRVQGSGFRGLGSSGLGVWGFTRPSRTTTSSTFQYRSESRHASRILNRTKS